MPRQRYLQSLSRPQPPPPAPSLGLGLSQKLPVQTAVFALGLRASLTLSCLSGPATTRRLLGRLLWLRVTSGSAGEVKGAGVGRRSFRPPWGEGEAACSEAGPSWGCKHQVPEGSQGCPCVGSPGGGRGCWCAAVESEEREFASPVSLWPEMVPSFSLTLTLLGSLCLCVSQASTHCICHLTFFLFDMFLLICLRFMERSCPGKHQIATPSKFCTYNSIPER